MAAYGRVLLACVWLVAASAVHAATLSLWDPREVQVLDLVNLQRSLHGLSALAPDDRLRDAAVVQVQDMSANDFFSHTGSDGSTPGDRVLAAGYNWNQPGGAVGENIAAGSGRIYDSGSGTFVETGAVDAARDVMYGTFDLSELSAFDQSMGGSGFGTWDQVGAGWGDAEWDEWYTARQSNGLGVGWMGSAGHRENILSSAFADIGVAYLFEPDDVFPSPFPNNYQTYWAQDFAAGDSLAAVPLPPAMLLFASAAGILGIQRRRDAKRDKACT